MRSDNDHAAHHDMTSAQPLNRSDLLAYAADLILELKDIAAKTECHMLTGLLDLAHTEAEACARTAMRSLPRSALK